MLNLFNRHQVLPYAIQKLQAAGYQLVTLAECLGMPAYQSVVAPGTPDVSPLPFCFFLFIPWHFLTPRSPVPLLSQIGIARWEFGPWTYFFFLKKKKNTLFHYTLFHHTLSHLLSDLRPGHCYEHFPSEHSTDLLRLAFSFNRLILRHTFCCHWYAVAH